MRSLKNLLLGVTNDYVLFAPRKKHWLCLVAAENVRSVFTLLLMIIQAPAFILMKKSYTDFYQDSDTLEIKLARTKIIVYSGFVISIQNTVQAVFYVF